MITNGSPYYFSTIRKLTVAFGSLFNNINIVRTNSAGQAVKTIKVPLSYGPKQRWYAAAKAHNSDGMVYRNAVPRLSFELKDIQYDANRQKQVMNRLQHANPQNTNQLLTQLNPVPYDFGFSVGIITKNIDDFLQIVEQILPNFTPDFNVTIIDIPQMNIRRDVPVIFGGISYDNPYEVGSFDEELKFITGELTFVCKGYLYRPIEHSAMIKHVLTTVKTPADVTTTNTPKVAVYNADVVPEEALPTDDFSILETWEEFDPDGTPV